MPNADGQSRLEDLARRRALLAERLQQAGWRGPAGAEAEEEELRQLDTEIRLIAGAN